MSFGKSDFISIPNISLLWRKLPRKGLGFQRICLYKEEGKKKKKVKFIPFGKGNFWGDLLNFNGLSYLATYEIRSQTEWMCLRASKDIFIDKGVKWYSYKAERWG